ncbi:MAG TPA: MBL fold metallo-hydrolase [Gemmataceae bacterium]|jgi:glyoxylase-like metal-dependent hydrolase (beta-lactamase superfamily II)
MKSRCTATVVCVGVFGAAVWVGTQKAEDSTAASDWNQVATGVFRSPKMPFGYALMAGEHALLIDAPGSADGLKKLGVRTIDMVLLTHHHRDTAAFAGHYLNQHVPVRASRASAEWLTPDGVRGYWRSSLPLSNSQTAYLVLPEGLAGVECSLSDGQTIDWNGWSVRVLSTPGHSRDHVAFVVGKSGKGPPLVFCGDALAAPGKMWSPYTTDWDHWTDAGLKPAAQSLHKIAQLKPGVLLPAHGPVIEKDAARALEQTAAAVEEVAFLKSFERFTKQRLKEPPSYRFLAREQAESNGSKPWSKISEHLFLTGNTYVLVSKEERAFLVVDPWDPHSARQLPKLKEDQELGKLEVVLTSHAHFDHYDGVYSILQRDKPRLWTLDRVAIPVADPSLLRAPFLDPRPVKFDRLARDGETLTWREYQFRFRFLPGQTEFTMGVETEIDGKKCFFTADNFFHQDQFSGTGGWMGLNRSFPLPYAESALKVLDANPHWVLAEHGGAMEFSAEDFRRRVQWGKECARAADAICISDNHRYDWDPHRIHIEPVVQKGKPGEMLHATLVVSNPLSRPQRHTLTLDGRGHFADQSWDVNVPAGGTLRRPFTLRLDPNTPAGRQVFIMHGASGEIAEGSDAFLAVDVLRK